MLNIDPLLFQPKVIRMSTTSNIGLPGQHIIRTTEYSNSQVMTGTTAHVHNEANNNILTSNNTDTRDDFTRGSTQLSRRFSGRDYRNFNEMDPTTLLEQDTEDRDLTSAQQAEWTAEQMFWSGDGEASDSSTLERLAQQNSASIISFQSNLSNSSASASFHSQLSEQSESKEEVISSLLNKVRSQNKVEASKILLAMSNTVENCIAMRQCGCLPLLIQLLHSPDENSNTYHMVHAKRVNFEIRERASQVLHNIVFSQPDDKKGRREARVLRLLEQIRDYCDQLRSLDGNTDDNRNARCVDQHLGPSVAALMKLSFDEDHRYAMCQLGGLQAIAELLQVDQDVHGCTSDQYCITIRRYSGMALTNLTFGDGANKALLCSMRPFMEALVAQLYSPSEDLRQVTASVLRNLSWRADTSSKRILRDVGAVTMLVKAAMEAEKESTLKSILSALWNLSAHCSGNKADICLVDGALAFLVSTLTYKSKSKTLAIVENGGGILRNVSSHIAIQNDYRLILRKHNCLQILLQHLKSPSLTVVSNACGTLWNLSARNAVDQRALWEMGAVGMLKKLINSKHKMISMGSSAALKNLLSARPPGVALGLCVHGDSYRCNDDAPSLMVRKQKALSTEIDQNLSETYDNTDSPKTSPVKHATQEKQTRSRRHISPSAARYMANQRLKNELSLPNRGGNLDSMNGSYVVEEKHNGAFQVTKNAKQALNYRQGQTRFQSDMKDNTVTNAVVHHGNDRGAPEGNCESKRLSFKPARNDRPAFSSAHTDAPKQNKPTDSARNTSRSMSPVCVGKDNRGLEKPTELTQNARTLERGSSNAIKPTNETNAGQKPLHESRIPLPKSVNKLDSQRSQSASPVPQRRSIPQRQENLNTKNVDITVTHPKYAWNSSPEKQDNDPEQPVNFSKRLGKDANHMQEYPSTVKPQKLFVSRLQQDDYNCGSEDEVKVYETESTPSNFSLMSSMQDLEDTGAKSRCSLNIKTSTNVKMIKNHPLLANVNANRCDDDGKFEYRQANKEEHFQNYGGGKTVDFSVQSDYDIDETLSMMSRSSSVASISSFDQQSFHEDESFASDLSHRTSGIESPSELSDSPCQTAPTSPIKSPGSSNYISLCGEVSDARSSATERIVETDPADRIRDLETTQVEARINLNVEVQQILGDTPDGKCEPPSLLSNAAKHEVNDQVAFGSLEESDIIVLHDHPEDQTFESENTQVTLVQRYAFEQPVLNPVNPDENERLRPNRVSRSSSSSSFSVESAEDISPAERLMLEECIRSGMPQQSQGVRQKIPQLSYQLLRDTVERHPRACSFESERGTLKNLEIKDVEYESLSENEEKGKEDERKAEKNRLFRIPESPVDKKSNGIVLSNSSKGDGSQQASSSPPINETPVMAIRKAAVDQKGNRRYEKYQSQQAKSKTSHDTGAVPNQLEFLMTSQKSNGGKDTKSNVEVTPKKNVDSRKFSDSADTKVGDRFNELKNKSPPSHIATLANAADFSGAECSENVPFSVGHSDSVPVERDNSETSSKAPFCGDSKVAEETPEKDIDCSERENSGDSDENMLSSTILDEAREIAEALLGARADSTEDMTCSTLSCLSDIDNARPPSVMADLGCLSMTNSSISDENLKVAVTRECQKLFGKSYTKQMASKKSLLRELQMGRLATDHGSDDNSKASNESGDNLSMRSSCTSDLLGNVNPPSVLDDMSLTASTGSLNGIESESECEPERNLVGRYASNQDSMSERMHDAAAMAQLYAKELSNMTGNVPLEPTYNDGVSRIKIPTVMQEVMEVTIADVTEIGCDTIGSDTELEDELPCDDEDPGSDTLQAPFTKSLTRDEPNDGSTENLTLTLTEEPPRPDLSPYFEFPNHSACFMTTEEFRALQENADMILNTLKDIEISDEEENGEEDNSHGDMLEDETMSLVSNESDDEFLSPDGIVHHSQKISPRGDFLLSPTCNGMVALPQSSNYGPSKYSVRKTALPSRNKYSGLPKTKDQSSKNRCSYPDSGLQFENNQPNLNDGMPFENRVLTSDNAYVVQENQRQNVDDLVENENGAFDSRTFTRKRTSIPKELVPSVQANCDVQTKPSSQRGLLKSPSSANGPSFPVSSSKTELNNTVASKIAGAWKNSGKTRSKSAADINRSSKLKIAPSGSPLHKGEERNGYSTRSSSETPSPKSPLSRSNTFEKLYDEESPQQSSIRRPSSLALAQKTNSPRHSKGISLPQRGNASSQKPTNDSLARQRTLPPKMDDSRRIQISDANILSPSTHQSSTNIPKMQNKPQASLIPSRRSMIPTPGKFRLPEN